MRSVARFLEEYGLNSLEKQEKFLRLAGEHNADLDFDAGLLRFNGKEVPFQVLGTESDNTLTWLWAWADEQTEIPDHLLKSSLQMKEWGASTGIQEFHVPSVDLGKADGHVISIIASAVCKASCYYHDPYEGGGLFLLLFDREIDQQPTFDLAGLSRQFTFLIQLYDFNHREALLFYFKGKGLPISVQGTAVAGELPSGEELHAEFDEHGNLISINGSGIAA